MSYTATANIYIDASPELVWKALTDPASVKAYLFGTNLETDWSIGSPIFFRGEYNGVLYEDKGVVLSFNPFTELSYSYLSSMGGLEDRPENYQTVRYALAEEKEGTLLTVTQECFESEERATHSTQSWNHVLKTLEDFVTGAKDCEV
ncbi:MAG: SRPBCC domain-containing protein [Simkaniaceae bacterium]|nr:SRPBCC domain-containing protein [Candidatus Sacchlamyda saccharinae]